MELGVGVGGGGGGLERNRVQTFAPWEASSGFEQGNKKVIVLGSGWMKADYI